MAVRALRTSKLANVAQPARINAVAAHDDVAPSSREDFGVDYATRQRLIEEVEKRHRAEASLRHSELRFQHLVEHATDIVYELDEGGRVVSCNEHAVRRSLGYTSSELIGRPLVELVPLPYQKPVREFIGQQARRPGEVGYFELPLLAKDRRLLWFGQHVRCLIDEGRTSGLQAVCRDITTQVERVHELMRSGEQWRDLSANLQSKIEAERSRIAQDIHDELGAALTAIRMELALPSEPQAVDATGPAGRNAAAIHRIDAAIEAMRRICTDLRPSLLDNMGLCAAIEWLAQDVQNRTGIRCTVSLKGLQSEPDPDRAIALFRIVQEAVTNAIRHSGASTLRIRQQSSKAGIVIAVSDDGCGISPTALAGRKSFGIVGMQERAKAFGGRVSITGGRHGTRVTVQMPL